MMDFIPVLNKPERPAGNSPGSPRLAGPGPDSLRHVSDTSSDSGGSLEVLVVERHLVHQHDSKAREQFLAHLDNGRTNYLLSE